MTNDQAKEEYLRFVEKKKMLKSGLEETYSDLTVISGRQHERPNLFIIDQTNRTELKNELIELLDDYALTLVETIESKAGLDLDTSLPDLEDKGVILKFELLPDISFDWELDN